MISTEGRGPARQFCDALCRRRERFERERDARSTETRNGPRVRPRARRYRVGDMFGSLTIVAYLPREGRAVRALFRCSCGVEKALRVANVSSGRTSHCGDRRIHARAAATT